MEIINQDLKNANLTELVEYLKERSKEICKENKCTEDNHNCESYAYITYNGALLDICLPDYFVGSGKPYAGIPLPFFNDNDGPVTENDIEDLKNEIENQCFDYAE
jgi:hypothetical protein